MENTLFVSITYDGQVPRYALIQKMKKIAKQKNIFISAPGGYGKTTAADQWLSSVKGKTVKVNLRESDNVPNALYRRFIEAVHKLIGKKPVPDDVVVTFERFLNMLNKLPKKNTRKYLIFDDFHLIKNEETLSRCAIITEYMPKYITQCLISRSEPPPTIVDAGKFKVITADELLFSQEECEWLALEKDLSLSHTHISNLMEITKGWPIYTSALLSGNNFKNGVIKSKLPNTLSQYFTEGIFCGWDYETKHLILSLSIPGKLTTELVSRITGEENGTKLLDRLVKRENTFLSLVDTGIYRFHDLFREFLSGHVSPFLSAEDVKRIHGVAAAWYYEQKEYYEGAWHYVQIPDTTGVSRCLDAINTYHSDGMGIAAEPRLNFIRRIREGMNPEIILENPSILCEAVVATFHDGDTKAFSVYMDKLIEIMPAIAEEYPELLETAVLIKDMDYRVSTKTLASNLENAIKNYGHIFKQFDSEAKLASITHGFPIFHRAQWEGSEYHAMGEAEMAVIKRSYGVILEEFYPVMENLIRAGLHYEKSDLVPALHHALNAIKLSEEYDNPEMAFSSYVILAYILYAMGADLNAGDIISKLSAFTEEKAQFLYLSFKAVEFGFLLRQKNEDDAERWLTVYANRSKGHLPFYQMYMHFTTIRAYLVKKDYKSAADFGKRLQTLAHDYNRPTDQIESSLLTAIALWQDNKKSEAITYFTEAVRIATPYGFVQLFINESIEVLPMLWELANTKNKLAADTDFIDKLTHEVYRRHKLAPCTETPISLTPQQSAILSYLKKGITYNEIAAAMGLGHNTVKSHVRLLYKNLGVRTAQEAVIKAKALEL